MNSDKHIFISYASEDASFAYQVCARLEARGLQCWIAPRDITPGMVYSEAIVDGISSAQSMVAIISRFANAAPGVLREVERAADKGVSIIPFRVDDSTLSKALEYFLGCSQWLDGAAGSDEEKLNRLEKAVERMLDYPRTVNSNLSETRPLADLPATSQLPGIERIGGPSPRTTSGMEGPERKEDIQPESKQRAVGGARPRVLSSRVLIALGAVLALVLISCLIVYGGGGEATSSSSTTTTEDAVAAEDEADSGSVAPGTTSAFVTATSLVSTSSSAAKVATTETQKAASTTSTTVRGVTTTTAPLTPGFHATTDFGAGMVFPAGWSLQGIVTKGSVSYRLAGPDNSLIRCYTERDPDVHVVDGDSLDDYIIAVCADKRHQYPGLVERYYRYVEQTEGKKVFLWEFDVEDTYGPSSWLQYFVFSDPSVPVVTIAGRYEPNDQETRSDLISIITSFQ